MAKVLVNESSLTGIADAIRGKNGSTTTYKPSEMAAAITAISGGAEPVIEALSITSNGTYTAPDGVDGYSPVTVNVPQDGGPPESAFVISGICSYRFAYSGWDWFIEQYANKITTENIGTSIYMFLNSNLNTIPFDLNFANNTYNDCNSIFSSCRAKKIGKIVNMYPSNMGSLFYGCKYLKELPVFENLNLDRVRTYKYSDGSNIFNGCYSLRFIPKDFLKELYSPSITSSSNIFLKGMFSSCCSLNEIIGISPITSTITSNVFSGTFIRCMRVKNIIFDTQDNGIPYSVEWKKQVIDLSSNVGYLDRSLNTYILNYNSGITSDKRVADDASYQALKNDPDWYTENVAYSRYNHDSAVATINSLPDTSAYLATAGGTNTIKFKGAAGSATDGGAISSLTQEEIAVATAKGWSVSFV